MMIGMPNPTPPYGTRSVHPAFKIQQGAMREARLLAAELGLTPHRRYHGADDKKGEDDDIPASLLG
jgi:phage terminase small subunit